MESSNILLSKMILSASGWRAVFAPDGSEEGRGTELSPEAETITRAAALAFCNFLKTEAAANEPSTPAVIVGIDTRPTGAAIAGIVCGALAENGCKVLYAGIAASPEIFAFARDTALRYKRCGFIYISASHNPIGHNGFKFGLSSGGVLSPDQAENLAEIFKSIISSGRDEETKGRREVINESPLIPQSLIPSIPYSLSPSPEIKSAALNSYRNFTKIVAEAPSVNRDGWLAALKRGIAARPIGIAADFNGSARTMSIDREFFEGLGLKFRAINEKAGEIVHKIVPEEDALLPCCRFLEEMHSKDESFLLGYVPDCDGDRGNLVIWDDDAKEARPLAAQEVFALACLAELVHQKYSGAKKIAVAINDPTSLRIDNIAETLGAAVFRAEVGEANVTALGKKLRAEGYNVRVMGEGAAGGLIVHPSAVRDPLHTVLSVVKLLTMPDLYNLWLRSTAATPRSTSPSISEILKTLPPFVTTGAYSADAKMKIRTPDHALLKRRYGEIFMRQWKIKKSDFAQFGIADWEAACYNGINEQIINWESCKNDFGISGKGGLKICFKDIAGKKIAAIWMRGSGTEPVFRIMAESAGCDPAAERFLINWQRSMVTEADEGNEYGGK